MDITKSRDLRYSNRSIFSPVIVGSIIVGAAVIGTISYFFGKRNKEENMFDTYNEKRSEINDLRNKVRILEFEVQELAEGGKTRLQKEIEVENTKEQLVQLESRLAILAKELNTIQEKQ